MLGVVLLAALIPAAAGALRSQSAPPSLLRAAGPGRGTQGGEVPIARHRAVMAKRGKPKKLSVLTKPTELHLRKAHSAVFDVRTLKSTVIKHERPEHAAPGEAEGTKADPDSSLPATVSPRTIAAPTSNAPAPAPVANFEGLDFANWGDGHPPDTNGDVGPTYYIQTINTSVGIYNKSNGSRVAAFTFNSFMSQGNFGNLCDTDNFGDPVVLYDSFEDRWFITDFAFKLDGSGNINPQHVFQCFAVSKTADPVAGGWNFYSIEAPGGIDDYPKFGVWPDGIYMSANMFGYGATASYIAPHVWAIDKAQMYAGEPSVLVADFTAPADDFTLLPANARLEAGTPPAGTPEYFVSTWEFLNGLTVYKLHVDWDKISTSTFTGPDVPLNATSWPNASVGEAPTPGNSLDTLEIRAMAQLQYSNIGGAESLWAAHTVRRANTTGSAAPRWYQLNVTGGTVAANTVQGTTWDPDGANTFYRFMPSLAVDRNGDMALGYSKSNSTTNPQIKYAGRLSGDPANAFSQTEQTLIDGTGTQSGNCGGSQCTRWGDYSGMALDPNGCTFWITNEYYPVTGLDHHTRIGSFQFPGCSSVGNGTLSGTVTDGSTPIAGATVALGSRTTTTNGSGNYSFSVPAGTYAALAVSKAGFDPASTTGIAVPDGGTATRNFTLNAAATSGCFVDNTQGAFQRGVPSNCDLTTVPGSVTLLDAPHTDQHADDNGFGSGYGFSSTSLLGQTFTAGATGKLQSVSAFIFCAGCSGADPNMTLELRTTSGGLPVMTAGGLIASSTIPGTSSGSGSSFTFPYGTQPTLTAGTQYGLVIRLVSNRTAGTQAWLSSSGDVMAGGRRVNCSTSACATPNGQNSNSDLIFSETIKTGFASSGTFVSSVKDANPAAGHTPTWTTLSFTATKPAGTDVKFQVAASNASFGPFSFVGPDGTASTFFTTSGASLSQFDGFRYLRYKAYLSTANSSTTPTLSSVSVCFNDVSGGTTATNLLVGAASGAYGGSVDLTATLTAGGVGVSGKTVGFALNGSNVGSALTNASGIATLNAASLAGINAGTYPSGVGASFVGDGLYDPSNASNSLTVAKANQTINVTTHAPATAVYNTSYGVAATGGGSGNPVTFSSSGVCTNSGNTFTMTSGTGTCTVKYDQAGNTNYNAAPEVTESVTALKAAQAINITAHAPATASFGTSFTVAATGGGAGNPVTYSSAGVCTNVGPTFTMSSGTGTCTVKYDEAGDANYNAAPEVTESVMAQKAAQTINVTTHAPASAVYNTSFSVAATGGGSGNPVTYSSAGGCTNAGAVFTMTSGTTACTIKYDQAGDANYNAAPEVTESVTAQKAAQSINVTTHPPASAVYNTSFGVAATAGSGNPVAYSSAGGCSNVDPTFTMTSGTTTCTVKYDQPGDDNYSAALEVTESVTAQKAAQTINVTTHAPATAVYDTSFGVAANAPGGLVSFSGAGVCTNSGNTFTMTSGTGTCTVKYDQAGDANYSAAPEVTESVTAQKAAQTINVTAHAPATASFGTSFSVAATGGGSGNAVAFSSAGVCTNVGATFTMTSSTGTCTVKYDQAGDADYDAAPEVTESIDAQKPGQSITVTTHAPTAAVYGTSFSVAATGGISGNPVMFSSAGVCSNVGAIFTMTSGTGTCTVKYDQAGDANYSDAPQVTETVTAQKAAQSISVTAHAPSTAVFATSFSVAATGGGSGNPVTYSSDGACSNVGALFTMSSGTGTCTVKYDQAGNDNYNVSPQVTESVTAQKAAQTIDVTTRAPASAVYNTSFGVAANAPGGVVSFSGAGVCTNSGNTFTMTSGTGTCTVKYDQAGDANYSDAPQVTETVTAQKAAQSITFNALGSKTLGNVDFDPGATASSRLAIAYSVSGSCSIVSGKVHITAAGSCTVTASQGGDSNYRAATPVSQTFTIGSLALPKCKVPNVVGKKLSAAKLALKAKHCGTGKVTRGYSKKITKGKVSSQSRRAGQVLAAGTHVDLVISKGRKP